MRLLQRDSTGRFSLTEDIPDDGDTFPLYAILSHTWGKQEVTFDDLNNNTGSSKDGYEKLEFCANQAEQDGLRYFWVDTCCINKADAGELQHAINSMFRWYQSAVKCYVYLSDISAAGQNQLSQRDWEPAFRNSRWFTRGWTLQELLAPRSVTFFSREGVRLGDRQSLKLLIHDITRITTQALEGNPLHEFGVEERLSWVESRQTTRKEDKAYSLLGIFGVFMSLIYGEGEMNARQRLRNKINKSSEKDVVQLTQSVQKESEGQFHDWKYSQSTLLTNAAPWMIPFARSNSFVGRGSLLAQIREHCLSKGGQKLTIYGLGGCGKTAIALEAAYELRDHNPLCAVFWIAAVSRESIELSFQEIGVLLNIPGILDQKNNAKQLVKARLSDETFGPWLLVVDNADDTSILFGRREGNHGAERLIDYLPSSRHGSVLITTRTRLAAVDLSGANSIALGQLTILEATEVLETRLLPEHRHEIKNRKVTNEFLGMLVCSALAIVQAAAFINKNDITLEDYISHYRAGEKDAMDLLSKEFEDQSRYRETENPIATTWYITFEQIRKHNDESVRLLSFMACMANNDIPETLLPPSNGKLKRAEAIGTLKAYAFITERTTRSSGQKEQASQPTKTFDIHPLVHLAMRGWLKAHDQWSLYITETMQRMSDALSYCGTDRRDRWIPYLLHASHFADIPELHTHKDSIQLLSLIGTRYRRLGRYFTSETYFRKAFERSELLLGRANPCTTARLHERGMILMIVGRFKEAESIFRETTARRKEIRTREDPVILSASDDLGRLFLMSRRYTEAREIQEEQVALSKEILGEMHPDTIDRMGLLAQTYHANNMSREARTMYHEQVQLSTQLLGETHMTTIRLMTGLADMLSDTEEHTEAVYLYRKTLTLCENLFGKEHPGTLGPMIDLSLALISSKQFNEAESLLHEAGSLAGKFEENPETLPKAMHYLALLFAAQKRYPEAEEVYQNLLDQQRSLCEKENQGMLLAVEGLACVVVAQGRYEEAVSLYKQVYNGRKRLFGLYNQQTIQTERRYIHFKRVLDGCSSSDEGNDVCNKNLRTAAQSDARASTSEHTTTEEIDEAMNRMVVGLADVKVEDSTGN
jgi:tetratricopeptide (TPR) repeat protein